MSNKPCRIQPFRRQARMHLERIKREITVMRNKAAHDTATKYSGSCYEGTIGDALGEVDTALRHIGYAIEELT